MLFLEETENLTNHDRMASAQSFNFEYYLNLRVNMQKENGFKNTFLIKNHPTIINQKCNLSLCRNTSMFQISISVYAKANLYKCYSTQTMHSKSNLIVHYF